VRRLHTVQGVRCWLSHARQSFAGDAPPTVGLVPTMGALHRGHLSLIERARQENDLTVVSIFVNPLQFGPQEDLSRYPRPIEADLALCQTAGVDLVFTPTPITLYGQTSPNRDQLTQVLAPPAMTEQLCGRSRPGHFQGVTTVVTKLFNIVQPDRAYFGQKDAQQLAIIKRLVQDLNLPIAIIACPIVREPDGLALSSRNQYLSSQERQQAVILYRGLKVAEDTFKVALKTSQLAPTEQLSVNQVSANQISVNQILDAVKAQLNTVPDIRLEYVDLVHPQTLEPITTLETSETLAMLAIAAHVGNTRLIDNIVLRARRPIIAIDGPAGAGKSTVARQLAHRLDLLYLDTGAMYRALTWYVLNQGVDPQDEVAVAELLTHCQIQLTSAQITSATEVPLPPDVWVNGELVTQAIRTAEVTSQVSTIAAQAAVRQALVEQQKQYGLKGGIVADGRDTATHVFPNAELKVFMTASVQERARRRQQDLVAQNLPVPDLATLEASIAERDRKDSTRDISPLRKADDAVELITDMLSIDQVIANITELYQQVVPTELPAAHLL
jgi:pantoate ligase / CMP/dCMP kinase